MAYTDKKKQIEKSKRFNKEHYFQVNINIPIEHKEEFIALAEMKGYTTLGRYIKAFLQEEFRKDNLKNE